MQGGPTPSNLLIVEVAPCGSRPAGQRRYDLGEFPMVVAIRIGVAHHFQGP